MNPRQQEIKALLEGHSTHKEQWLKEFPLGFPSITTEELKELEPMARQISDRFQFAVVTVLSRRRNS